MIEYIPGSLGHSPPCFDPVIIHGGMYQIVGMGEVENLESALWKAPEVFTRATSDPVGNPSPYPHLPCCLTASDIHAFGKVIMTVMSGEQPYSDCTIDRNRDRAFRELITGGFLPTAPKCGTFNALWKIINECLWHPNPDARWTAKRCTTFLGGLSLEALETEKRQSRYL